MQYTHNNHRNNRRYIEQPQWCSHSFVPPLTINTSLQLIVCTTYCSKAMDNYVYSLSLCSTSFLRCLVWHKKLLWCSNEVFLWIRENLWDKWPAANRYQGELSTYLLFIPIYTLFSDLVVAVCCPCQSCLYRCLCLSQRWRIDLPPFCYSPPFPGTSSSM